MGNIDFFCCNCGEIVFYLPIFKYLKNAKMVVLSSRYDHLKTKKYLEKLKIPYQDKPSASVNLVITTQTKPEPWSAKYWKNVPKIRIIYSLCEKNKLHQRKMLEPFSLVLSPGIYSHNKALQFTKSIITGYPKYDEYLKGLIKKEEALKELNLHLDNGKKTILYAPTFNQYNRSSIPIFYNQLIKLTNKFNIIYKPHVYTEFNEKYFIELFKGSGIITVPALTWFDRLLVISDIVIGDAQSGVIWEGVITDKPTLACIRKSDIPFKGLEMPVVNGEVVPIVEIPMDLRNVVENLLDNPSVWKKKRFIWANKVCSYRDGTAGFRAAQIISEFTESNKKLSRTRIRKNLNIIQPTRTSLFKYGLRKILQYIK